jgi:hypothetical protein
MHTRPFFGALGVALTALVLASTPALAAGPRHPHRARAAGAGGYVNPFTDSGWQPSRTDMGVDWAPVRPEPVLAVGDAVVLGSDWHAPWPGGRFIYYQLTGGNHTGDIVYVAENLRHLVPAGTHVQAGQQIAVALPGYPWIEMGWADQYGSPIAYPCYKDGQQTASGKRMARFLESLGATVAENPGSGPDTEAGRLC